MSTMRSLLLPSRLPENVLATRFTERPKQIHSPSVLIALRNLEVLIGISIGCEDAQHDLISQPNDVGRSEQPQLVDHRIQRDQLRKVVQLVRERIRDQFRGLLDKLAVERLSPGGGLSQSPGTLLRPQGKESRPDASECSSRLSTEQDIVSSQPEAPFVTTPHAKERPPPPTR